ncbi:MAG: DUF3488 and transglutaminase-like domain-containing protein [Verrucomicrobiota bacterium]
MSPSRLDPHAAITGPQLYRLLGCYAASVLLHLSNVSWWLLLAVILLAYWRLQIKRAKTVLPSLFTRALLAGFLFLGVLIDMGTVAGRDSGTMLMVGLVAIKFLELRSKRDYLVISFVLYFLTLVSLLFDQSIVVFGLVMLICGLITANLLAYHTGESAGVWLPRRRLLRLTSWMLIQALPLALVLFVFFPRVQGKFGFNLGISKTGLSADLQPGDVSALIFDDEMAFRVEFPPDSDRPPPQSMYFRAFVLWDVDASKNRWTQGRTIDEDNEVVGGRMLAQTVTLPATGERWLFALDYPLDSPPIEPTWVGEIKSGHCLRSPRPLNRKVQYNVVSRVGGRLRPVAGELPSYVRLEALEINNRRVISARVKRFAQRMKERGETPEGIVREILAYFRTGGFRYTSLPGTYSRDMLSEFLFVRKQGYCEHYATAMATLLRLAGVPCRLVVGYQGAEYNPYGDFYVVRQANAHVWVEAFVPEKGWVRYDPTSMVSPARIAVGPEQVRREINQTFTVEVAGQPIALYNRNWVPEWMDVTLNEADLRWQQVEQAWDQWVLSYNPESQRELLGQAGMSRRLRYLTFFLVAVIMAGLTLALVWWLMRRKTKAVSAELKRWEEFNRLLGDAGAPRRRWEGPLAYAQRAASILPGAAEPIHDFTEAYVRVRYAEGSPEAARADIQRLDRSLQRLRGLLKESASPTAV